MSASRKVTDADSQSEELLMLSTHSVRSDRLVCFLLLMYYKLVFLENMIKMNY